jgi:hypothetical protein
MVGIRSPYGLVVGLCTSHPGILGSIVRGLRVRALQASDQQSPSSGNHFKTQCAACSAGYYKDWLGDEACASCAVGPYNPDTNWTFCPFCIDTRLELLLDSNDTHPVLDSRTTVYEASDSVRDCVCERGHEQRYVLGGLATTACRPCLPGSFKEHKEHEHCSYCGSPKVRGM